MQLVCGLRATLLLMRGRVEGLLFASLSRSGAARSFWAAAICLPIFVLLRLSDPTLAEGDPTRRWIAELAAYAAAWSGFALASQRLAAAWGRAPLWPRFLAAWNWMSLGQYALLVLISLIPDGPVANAAQLAVFGYVLWLEWFVARIGLRLHKGPALVVVALDLVISLLLNGTVDALARGLPR
ncbi:hypothetical protein [Roseomonas sp. BN140053]|uniref:hypothetical protein n=1 Tax=Roseomonas sp. BN140053 TaxID=3391898 RepID=UPI0039E9FC96